MVQRCSICSHYQQRDGKISFYKLPINSKLRTKWMEILDIKPDQVNVGFRVCGRHFPAPTKYQQEMRRLPHDILPLKPDSSVSAASGTATQSVWIMDAARTDSHPIVLDHPDVFMTAAQMRRRDADFLESQELANEQAILDQEMPPTVSISSTEQSNRQEQSEQSQPSTSDSSKKYCAVCRLEQQDSTTVPFFKIPTDDRRRKLWIRAMKLPDDDGNDLPSVCGRHFPSTMFENTNRRSLSIDAFPSLFNKRKWNLEFELPKQIATKTSTKQDASSSKKDAASSSKRDASSTKQDTSAPQPWLLLMVMPDVALPSTSQSSQIQFGSGSQVARHYTDMTKSNGASIEYGKSPKKRKAEVNTNRSSTARAALQQVTRLPISFARVRERSSDEMNINSNNAATSRAIEDEPSDNFEPSSLLGVYTSNETSRCNKIADNALHLRTIKDESSGDLESRSDDGCAPGFYVEIKTEPGDVKREADE